MTKPLYLLTFLFFSVSIIGQTNLVPNPSFETYTSCPTAFSQVHKAVPWEATNGSSELFNQCGTATANAPNTAYGYQAARTGSAYAGQYFMNGYGTSNREYIQSPLSATLTTGSCYLVKFYVNSVNKIINYACNNFAAHLSVGGYTTGFTAATSYTPQVFLVNNPIVKDTLHWKEIGGIYTAVGGEDHITIGNFKDDAGTDTLKTNNGTISAAYYFIDDVSVQQITTPTWKLRDTLIFSGDSVLIGPLYSGLSCSWFNLSGTLIGSGAGIYVKPPSTTSYVLKQTFCNTTFYDTMIVYINSVGLDAQAGSAVQQLKLYPNPTQDLLYLTAGLQIDPASKIEISSSLGELVLSSDYQAQLDLSTLQNGIYLLRLKTPDGSATVRRCVISR